MGGTWATLADSFLYEPATNRRYAWRFGNNLPKLITLDTDGRIAQLAGGGVHNIGIGYSSIDTLTSKTDYVYASLTATYSYDAVDRLSSVSATDAQAFGYDLAGNRTSQSRQGAAYGMTIDSDSNRLTAFNTPSLTRSSAMTQHGISRRKAATMAAAATRTTPSTG